MSDIKDAFEALEGVRTRVRRHDETISVKHPGAVRALVKKVAATKEVTEGAIWREAMAEYLTRRGYNR